VCPFAPTGHPPDAIEGHVRGLAEGGSRHCLLGLTGSGQTFTMASVIARAGRTARVL
jgi:excinuclease ABC subunit B